MSLRVAAGCRAGSRPVVDSLARPLPVDEYCRGARVRAVLVVDETRRTGGVSEGVVTALAPGYRARSPRVTSEDSFVPRSANTVLLDEPRSEGSLGLCTG